MTGELVKGRDYTIESGAWVFTRDYLLRRGQCCGSGCRNCPYRKNGGFAPEAGNKPVRQDGETADETGDSVPRGR